MQYVGFKRKKTPTDLVNNSHVDLQNVRNVYCGSGGCLKGQTQVVNHHLHNPGLDGGNLGTHRVKVSGLAERRTKPYGLIARSCRAAQTSRLTCTVLLASWNSTLVTPLTLVLTKK